eukprot:6297321-Amphidinium_carterae.1
MSLVSLLAVPLLCARLVSHQSCCAVCRLHVAARLLHLWLRARLRSAGLTLCLSPVSVLAVPCVLCARLSGQFVLVPPCRLFSACKSPVLCPWLCLHSLAVCRSVCPRLFARPFSSFSVPFAACM